MTTWRYIKGSEKDFEGYSNEVLQVRQRQDNKLKFGSDGLPANTDWLSDIIAQREPAAINDNRPAHELPPRSIHHPDGTVSFGCIQTPLIDVDMVNHPSHYTQGGIECIDAIKAATVGKTGIEAVCVANVVKYLWRYEEKNGLEDVKKARWYLERLINELSEGDK